MTSREFLERARNVHGYKYEYPSIGSKLKFKDRIEIEFEGVVYHQTVSKHLSGRCPEKATNKKTTEDFINESRKIWGNKYDYSLVNYKGALSTIKIIYNGIVYEQRASSHLNRSAPEFRKNDQSILMDSIVKSEKDGILEVKSFLDRNKIEYLINHKIDNFIFDFYIPSMRTCIEFDGRHHFECVENLGGSKAFKLLQIGDKDKNNYCEENYINLIRIRYDQIEDIQNILWENLKVFIKMVSKNKRIN